MESCVKSVVGLVRDTNEDNYAFIPPTLYAVADGMGGHVAGEIASKLASSVLSEYVMKATHNAPCTFLKEAIQEANRIIYQMSKTNLECAGMGTTLTAVYIENNVIYWGHVGDSRLYLLRNNDLRQLTSDHSLVEELFRSGSISKDEALVHPQRNILTRAVGTSNEIEVDIGQELLKPNDILLLCTDGLTNMVSEESIHNILSNKDYELKEALDNLIEQAILAGGLDNITAILVKNGA